MTFHCMLDLETMGTTSGSVIASIGAVMFDVSSTIKEMPEFHYNVDLESCVKAGLAFNGDTVYWWLSQEPAARLSLINPEPMNLDFACFKFKEWYESYKPIRLWAHGASFDPPILEAGFKAVNKEIPWKFWDVRDTRTIFELAFSGKPPQMIKGTLHNALHDAKNQALQLQEAYRILALG